MTTLWAFLLAIALLVAIHEWGHYFAAKRLGVKVLTFSIGFGPKLLRKQVGETEWVLSLIPLGGFVKMLDERDMNVTKAEKSRAFTQKKPWQRMIIVAAGPFANFVLAIVLFFAVFLGGIEQLKPGVGSILPESPALSAGIKPGDFVSRVNGEAVENWEDLHSEMIKVVSRNEHLNLDVLRQGQNLPIALDLAAFGIDELTEKTMTQIGIRPVRLLNKIGGVAPKGAADLAGLKEGDTILTMDGKEIKYWEDASKIISDSPNKTLSIKVKRDDKIIETQVTPQAMDEHGVSVGRLGVYAVVDESWMESLRYTMDLGVIGSLAQAVNKTYQLSVSSLEMMGRMLFGGVSWQAVSGPLTIAEYAGKTADRGMSSYLMFIALISVSLGVLNLLPIPVLDGGHLIYYGYEWITGKAVSTGFQVMAQKVGLAMILSLMALALFNDFGRLLG